MVQKDDHVRIIYFFDFADGETGGREEKVLKTVDGVLENLFSPYHLENKSGISRCIFKVLDYEKDVTSFVRRYNSQNSSDIKKIIQIFLDKIEMEETTLNVLADYSHQVAPCIDDKIQLGTSASPTNYINQVQSINLEEPTTFNLQADKRQKRTCKISNNLKFPNNANPSKKLNEISDSESAEKNISFNHEEVQDYRYVGLVNQAMTCYLNSLLQALYMTPEFRNALYNWEYKKNLEKDSNNSIPYQLQKLFLNLQTSYKNAVETTFLTRSFGWDSNDAWQQHDIQELCRVMFDALEQNFKNTAQADLINRLYEGKINDYVKCLTCNTEKFREDTFLDIPLPVRPFDNNVAYGSVEEALEAFVKYETLEGNNQYFCEKCDKKSDAHKGLKFTKFPYILTLQLKRFDFDQNAFHRIKLNDKVTFPDVLNLNSFIDPVSNQESPSREEDPGMSTKCDDSCTTDSSTIEEECALCDVPMTNSNHVSNHHQEDDDDDQDEGIDVRNGTSSSSSSTYYHNSEKRDEYAASKGPYIYDLFSVMIHSGSASGGHYYAYIKDFRNDKWLCFNDVSVSPITQEDIQRSYGGGSRVGCYSGAYRSSTNAYMLMYRQIDPERNALPMDSKDFPPHIKDLLEKMKKSEEDRRYHEEIESTERPFKQLVYYRHPSSHNIEQVSVFVSRRDTLAEVAEQVYKKAQLDDLVDLDQCRIVHYHVKYDLIDSSYEQTTKLDKLSISKPITNRELFLEIRGKSEKFEDYPFMRTIITKVYVIDAIEKELLEAPKYVRAHTDQSIKEFKEELTKHFNIDPNNLQLLGKEIMPKKLLEDDYKFESHLSSRYAYKIYATDAYDPMTGHDLTSSSFYEFAEELDATKTFFIDPKVVEQEPREKFNVPSLNFLHGEVKTSGNIFNYHNGLSDDRNSSSSTPLVFDYTSKEKHQEPLSKLFLKQPESRQNILNSEEVFLSSNKVDILGCKANQDTNSFQETSNSEDSSLSDSDRTLVGDAPEESENEFESAISHLKANKNEVEKFFKLFELKRPSLWKVTIDQTMTEEDVKKKLEQYLNIPKNYFKIVDLSIDECSSYTTSEKLKDDIKYSIVLERVIQPDEKKMDIYCLKMDSYDPLQKFFTAILKRDMNIGAAKQEILTQLRQQIDIELPYERWNFMECTEDWVGNPLDDDEKSLSEVFKAICIQELPDENLLAGRKLVYVRKFDRSEMHLHYPQEIKISIEDFHHQFPEKVASLSNIPSEQLEFATIEVKKKYLGMKIEYLSWKPEVKVDEVESKTYILYRDTRVPKKKLTNAEDKKFEHIRRQKENSISAYTPSSLRKEKGLKIHVDST